MIPRVFVSSTYYDLKHVRERIEKFITEYGFEPVLFESDKITYQHGTYIDQSAYYEVGLCHIMILIIGGRYGSPISQNDIESERKKYDENYISITRKEFETAKSNKTPILIFIDKNVYAEYQTYKENESTFSLSKEKNEILKSFRFAHVDNINVFRFIDTVKAEPLKTFDKIEEIENYFKSQVSGMFYLYLESLKKSSETNKILDTVTELNSVTLRMNEMVNSMGKQILGNDNEEYEKVIESQFSIILDFYEDRLKNAISFNNRYDDELLKGIDTSQIANFIFNEILKTKVLREKSDKDKMASLRKWIDDRRVYEATIIEKFNNFLSKVYPELSLNELKIWEMKNAFDEKIAPILDNEKRNSELVNTIKKAIESQLQELPF